VPEPLAALVRELVATRKGSNIITAPDAKPWLFPGRRPGHPLGNDRLGQRLQQIGLKPCRDRSTALFALATELPAAMLARMLGTHIQVAVQWQQASSGDWIAYAAGISRRSQHATPEAGTNRKKETLVTSCHGDYGVVEHGHGRPVPAHHLDHPKRHREASWWPAMEAR
jgi:hypothetical protein